MSQRLTRLFTEDQSVATVISLNAIVLFLLSFDQMKPWFDLLGTLDFLFLIFFMLEAILKIRMLGWRNYIRDGWNKFDFIIVVLSLPSLILIFEHTLPDFAFIVILRIVRVLRFFKFIKFIPNIQDLISGVRRAFRASVFVLMAFFIFGFIISLISCRLYKPFSEEMFGDPIVSYYHIFKIFTIEGWYEIPERLIAEGGENMSMGWRLFTKLYFVAIVLIGGLFGFSIVNAIFVDEMVRDNNDDLILQIEEVNKKLDELLADKNNSHS